MGFYPHCIDKGFGSARRPSSTTAMESETLLIGMRQLWTRHCHAFARRRAPDAASAGEDLRALTQGQLIRERLIPVPPNAS
jgi:hypothetical protein